MLSALMESFCIYDNASYTSLPPTVMRFATTNGPGKWLVDRCNKRLADGQQFSCCTIVELDTRSCLVAIVAQRFGTAELISALEDALAQHEPPGTIFVGQHTSAEFHHLVMWGVRRGVEILPNIPSGTGSTLHAMRMPAGERWSSLDQAKRTIARWRRASSRQLRN
ncbi:hypothetical protein DMC47_27085 [Nostoc sp. 3335mG]|nr:hypothetical protein DMC47_27085 [Nostoc sp. 3335mG]